MNFSSDSKENSIISVINKSIKRKKDNENMSAENIACKSTAEDSESNLSVTVYEDKTEELVYFNKSAKKRVINSSIGKRSPLASINKTNSRLDGDVEFPILKLDESYCRRLHMRAQAPPFDQFSRLSDEIVLHIFQYLPKKALNRLAQVNSRFSRIILDESLWIRLDLANKSFQPEAAGRILSRGLIICRLAQAKIQSPIFDESLDGIQLKLQYLDLSLASIDISSLTQLLSACRQLKKLSLEQVEVDNQVCKEIAENKQLEVLNLAMCEGLTLETIKLITRKLSLLVALNVSWTNLSRECVSALVGTISPTLLRLNISGCRRALSDEDVETLVRRCPNLAELDVSDSNLLTAATLNAVSTLRFLEYLSLSRCYNIPMTSYLVLHNIKSLMYLDVFGLLSENGLQMFEKTFKNIGVNKFIHSSVARPTIMPRRTSIWGLRTRDITT